MRKVVSSWCTWRIRAVSSSGSAPGRMSFSCWAVTRASTTPAVSFSAAAVSPDAVSSMSRCVLPGGDGKSTRLNSSHVSISYAVFYCLALARVPHSSPTRRSSDLGGELLVHLAHPCGQLLGIRPWADELLLLCRHEGVDHAGGVVLGSFRVTRCRLVHVAVCPSGR